MSKRGFVALFGALLLTLAVMIGAWSYSMATVISQGTLKIAASSEALIGTPSFGLAPLVAAQRAATGEARFAINVRTANPVTLSISLRGADSRLGAVLWVDGGEGVVQISPLNQPSFAVGMYLVQAAVIAQSAGFRAAVDVDIPVEVLNAPIVANDDFAITSSGAMVSIPVLANDSHPDGGMVIVAVDTSIDGDETGTDGTVTINGNAIDFLPSEGFLGETTFRYTISFTYDGVTESATAKVTVTVTE
jgi:hypothetical protein